MELWFIAFIALYTTEALEWYFFTKTAIYLVTGDRYGTCVTELTNHRRQILTVNPLLVSTERHTSVVESKSRDPHLPLRRLSVKR